MTQLMDRTLHVRFDGRSEEVPASMLHLPHDASDAQIKRTLTGHFDLPNGYFNDHVVVRNSNSIIIRPEAIYG